MLEEEIFPALVAKHSGELPVRVWVPSCATGEEAYSIGIGLVKACENAGKPVNIQIFASDINQHSISLARRGIYPASIASDISPKRLKQFFMPHDEIHYQVSKQLRDSIVFSKQNVISDAPFSKMDLISCRNFLIYLEPTMQQKLISVFHYALVEDGHLILGPSETIGRAASLFETISKKWRLNRRVGPTSRVPFGLPIANVKKIPHSKPSETLSSAPRKSYKEMTETVLSDYAPTAALVNRHFDVLYVSGALADYLEFPTGELTNFFLAMARTGLRTRLRAAYDKAISQRVTVTDSRAFVQRGDVYIPCTITARPLIDSQGSDGLALVLLKDNPVQVNTEPMTLATRFDSTKKNWNHPKRNCNCSMKS